jgi:hypothetical protein
MGSMGGMHSMGAQLGGRALEIQATSMQGTNPSALGMGGRAPTQVCMCVCVCVCVSNHLVCACASVCVCARVWMHVCHVCVWSVCVCIRTRTCILLLI